MAPVYWYSMCRWNTAVATKKHYPTILVGWQGSAVMPGQAQLLAGAGSGSFSFNEGFVVPFVLVALR